MDSFKGNRKSKKEKEKRNFEINGKFSSRHVRIQQENFNNKALVTKNNNEDNKGKETKKKNKKNKY